MEGQPILSVSEFTDMQSLELSKKAIRFVHPIAGADERGVIEPIGSAVLIRSHERRALVTAKHVLDHNVELETFKSTTLYLGFENRTYDQNVILGESLRVADPYDVALIEPAFLNELPSDNFLDLDNDFVDDRSDFDFYLVVGYPIREKAAKLDRAKRKLNYDPLLFTGTRKKQAKFPHHIHLNCNMEKVRSGNQIVNMGKPQGASGGGVFPNLLATASPQSPKLAGIAIEYHKSKRVMIVTRSSVVRKLFQA